MTGVLFILYLGGARVQSGAWDIAAFTTFIACFAKLSVKSSKAAKLFNAVQQAQVSWGRIKGFLCTPPEERDLPQKAPCCVKATGLSVPDVLENANFEIGSGQIIGITALAVSVDPEDFENGTPFGGVALQRRGKIHPRCTAEAAPVLCASEMDGQSMSISKEKRCLT